MKRVRGFTLIELMIVVTVVAILAAFAINAYNGQMRKSRRAEAKQAVTNLALAEEKYRSNNAAYTTSQSTLLGSAPTFTYYTVAIATPATTPCPDGVTATTTGNSFRVTATAKSGGPQTSDAGCTAIVLNSKCGQVIKTPTACWN